MSHLQKRLKITLKGKTKYYYEVNTKTGTMKRISKETAKKRYGSW